MSSGDEASSNSSNSQLSLPRDNRRMDVDDDSSSLIPLLDAVTLRPEPRLLDTALFLLSESEDRVLDRAAHPPGYSTVRSLHELDPDSWVSYMGYPGLSSAVIRPARAISPIDQYTTLLSSLSQVVGSASAMAVENIQKTRRIEDLESDHELYLDMMGRQIRLARDLEFQLQSARSSKEA